MTFTAQVRLAVVLWLVLGIVVWNVIFDRVLVLAGRVYAWRAANVASGAGYLPIEDVMPDAIRHGVRVASFWAVLVAAIGLVLVAVAARRTRS